MARKANDGTEFTNQMMVNRHNARLAANDKPDKAPKMDDDNQDQGQDIQSDPEAMQAIELLKQKGYSAEQVEEAMGGQDEDDQQQVGGYSGGVAGLS